MPHLSMALVPSWSDLPPDAFLRDGGRYQAASALVFHRRWRAGAARAAPAPLAAARIQRAAWRSRAHVRADEPGRHGTARLGGRCCAVLCRRCARSSKARNPGSSKRTSSASTPPTASADRRRRVPTVMGSISSSSRWSIAVASKGGETRVFDADGPTGIRFTMTEPWTPAHARRRASDPRNDADSTACSRADSTATATRWC